MYSSPATRGPWCWHQGCSSRAQQNSSIPIALHTQCTGSTPTHPPPFTPTGLFSPYPGLVASHLLADATGELSKGRRASSHLSTTQHTSLSCRTSGRPRRRPRNLDPYLTGRRVRKYGERAPDSTRGLRSMAVGLSGTAQKNGAIRDSSESMASCVCSTCPHRSRTAHCCSRLAPSDVVRMLPGLLQPPIRPNLQLLLPLLPATSA